MKSLSALFAALLLMIPFALPAQEGERSAPNIAALTADILKKSHGEQFQNRPALNDYSDFDLENTQIKQYLSTVQGEKPLAREKRRIKLIASIKLNLIRAMERNPYNGPIQFRRGGNKRGVIALANENNFRIKGKRRGKDYKWETITPLQLARMSEYYADQKTKLKGAKTAGMKDDAARQLIAAAVICDWYGDYDNAVKFVKKAASLAQDEKVKNLAEALFLD